jgi:hypothetical protein
VVNSEVQNPHRVALTGITEKQRGHSLVVGSGGGASSFLFSELMPLIRRKTANATIRKLMTVFIKTP